MRMFIDKSQLSGSQAYDINEHNASPFTVKLSAVPETYGCIFPTVLPLLTWINCNQMWVIAQLQYVIKLLMNVQTSTVDISQSGNGKVTSYILLYLCFFIFVGIKVNLCK